MIEHLNQIRFSRIENPFLASVLTALLSLLRGVSQVFFQKNAFSGAVILIGLFYSSALSGTAVVVGVIVSTMTASILGAKTSQIKDGLYGFNGALVALALIIFVHDDPLVWPYLIVASSLSTIVTAATLRFLDVWGMPTLTFPFVATTHIFLLAIRRFESVHFSSPVSAMQIEGLNKTITFSEFGRGVLSGIAQVFLQSSAMTGTLFLLAIFIGSRRSSFMAIGGSVIGALTGYTLGASASDIGLGLFGFNSSLTAIALGSIFLTPGRRAVGLTVFAAIITIVFQSALETALKPFGLPAMTLPFVLTTWLFLLAEPLLRGTTGDLEG